MEMPPRPALTLAACAAMAATPAVAWWCPKTTADAAKGLMITYQDQSDGKLMVTGNGITEDHLRFNDGSGMGEAAKAKHGYIMTELYATENGRVLPDALLFRDYPPEFLSLPPLKAGESVKTMATTIFGTDETPTAVTFTAGREVESFIGWCPLRGWTIEAAFEIEASVSIDHYLYLADLDTAIYIGTAEPNWPVRTGALIAPKLP